MSTPEERQRVAAQLREQPTIDMDTPFEEAIGYLCDAVSGETDGRIDPGMWTLQAELADLVDPTCHVGKPSADEDGIEVAPCSGCGFTASPEIWEQFDYCPNCGCRIVEEEK